jgi:hypothetical protein
VGGPGSVVDFVNGYEWGDPKNVEYVEWLYDNCEEDK